jgi:hypothetical protein
MCSVRWYAPSSGRQSIGDLDQDQSKGSCRDADTQDEANRIGRNATAVNSIESRSEIAPSLSHSTMASPLLTQAAIIESMQPERKMLFACA